MNENTHDKIKYESDWIEVKQAAALFEAPEQFIRAAIDGRIRTTGRLWSEGDPEEIGDRKLIDPAAWENFEFDKEKGELCLDDRHSPWSVEYVSIRVSYTDIIALSPSTVIKKPAQIAEEKKLVGGRPSKMDFYKLAVNIAAYYASEGGRAFFISPDASAKDFQKALDLKISYLHDSGVSSRTVERTLARFMADFRKAENSLKD